MRPVENKLDELLVKKAPYQLPPNAKKSLVGAMPYLALVGGVLALLGAWGVYQVAAWANSWLSVANDLSATYGYGVGYTAAYGPLLWVSLLLLLAEAVAMFVAFSPLKAHKKRGWDLLFWVSLLNLAYAVVYLIARPDIMQFVFSLLGSVIGLYLLFQVRSSYTGAAASSTPAPKE